MVNPTEHAAPIEVGVAAFAPWIHVMGPAVAHSAVASREAAPAVAVTHGAALRFREQPLGASHVQHLVVLADEDPADLGVATKPADGLDVQRESACRLAEPGLHPRQCFG